MSHIHQLYILSHTPFQTAGGPCWRMTAVGYILCNEKYVGDSLLQKSYTTKTFPHRIVKNHGSRPQYLIRDSHPAIIDRNTFEQVQKLLKRRREALHPQPQEKYTFTGKIICQTCGATYKEVRKDFLHDFRLLCAVSAPFHVLSVTL